MFRTLFVALITMLPALAQAQDVLHPEKAYTYEISADAGDIILDWHIEDGYYLYREKYGFESLHSEVVLGQPIFPKGEIHSDEFFGEQEIYRGDYRIIIPYTAFAGAPEKLSINLKLQGCADIGLCYPPQTWQATVALLEKAADRSPGLLQELNRDAAMGATGGHDQQFLPVDDAFVFRAMMEDAYTLRATWVIADGYYMYKDKFAFSTNSDTAQLGVPRFPESQIKTDEYFGESEVFYRQVDVLIPISRTGPQAGQFDLEVAFQGCAEDGICYPPTLRSVTVSLPAASADDKPRDFESAPVSEQDRLSALITNAGLLAVMATFFGFGLLLAFTPCVLPMIPILSGIIAGQGENVSTGRAFSLSLTYVLGMALTYTVAGAAFAAVGSQAQSFFQQPWLIISFSLLFVVLALSMFGLFELQMPSALQSRLADASNKQKTGTFVGTAIMGALSALVVTACVAPPLVAALAVIGQSGDVIRGSAALFALSMGMGTPLLIIGTSAGRLLPKAGPWMDKVKGLFGVMLLGVSVWMLDRILPGSVILFMWAGLAFVTGVYLGALEPVPDGSTGLRYIVKAIGLLALAYGVLMLVGAATGGDDPLRPLHGSSLTGESSVQEVEFIGIKSVADLDAELTKASSQNKTALLDFYADWCVSCKEMEKYSFPDPAVQAALTNTVLLQADVTANDDVDQALLKKFGIFGPPSIIFFDSKGDELQGFRIVGFVRPVEFAAHIEKAVSFRQ